MPPKKSVRKRRTHSGHSHEPLKFPRGFLWGAATSAHQVEGNNRNNDWWAWEQRKGTVANGDHSGKASDHYNRFEEDFDLAQSIHHNAHRFSIEWSRIEPQEGKWDFDQVEHYRQVLKALRKRKIKSMVTLHHFTNPVWVAQKGGWVHRDTPRYFARYAAFIAEQLGEYVDYWITINEPGIYTAQAYAVSAWPPQEHSFFHGVRAYMYLAKGHRLAYKAIHAAVDQSNRKRMHRKKTGRSGKRRSAQVRTAHVGIAKNMLSVVMYRNRFFDYLYARFSEFVWNDLFFLMSRGSHDFIGVNYYFHHRVKRRKGGGFIFVDVRSEEKRESSDLGWEVYAPGLFNVLLDLQKYGKPILITENGIATTNDDKRIRYIVSHVKELYHAIQAGIDVRGYFHWSLLDNFEWDKGFGPRFGLVEVNYGNFKRTPRPSAYVYGEICKENSIEHGMLRFLGHGVSVADVCKECNVKMHGLP